MRKTRAYKSSVDASIHEIASGLHVLKVIDKQTMREFDEGCLTAIEDFTPEAIRALREREEVSQAVFARHLNVSKDSICKWESGAKHPAGPSLKLLSLVKKKGLTAIT
ncbi:helix-turn-helix domain-containing protein [bacterium]|nr:helix-turn-helix domain-containing protein [bacterium]